MMSSIRNETFRFVSPGTNGWYSSVEQQIQTCRGSVSSVTHANPSISARSDSPVPHLVERGDDPARAEDDRVVRELLRLRDRRVPALPVLGHVVPAKVAERAGRDLELAGRSREPLVGAGVVLPLLVHDPLPAEL